MTRGKPSLNYKGKRAVLTGPPASGKTAILRAAKDGLQGAALFVPEVATMLLSGGFPSPGDFKGALRREVQAKLQAAIIGTQLNVEAAISDIAYHKDIPGMVCDRGMIDAAAYAPGSARQFFAGREINYESAIARYDLVIILETVALKDKKLYNNEDNPSRFETAEQAIALDARIKEVWSEHPNKITVSVSETIEEKIAIVMRHLRALLAN